MKRLIATGIALAVFGLSVGIISASAIVIDSGTTFFDFLQFDRQAATPAVPPANTATIYAKIDDRFYRLTSTGTENSFMLEGISSVDELADIQLNNVVDGEILKFNAASGKWENAPLSEDLIGTSLSVSASLDSEQVNLVAGQGDYGGFDDGEAFVNIRNTANDGSAIRIETDNGSGQSAPLAFLHVTNPTFNDDILRIMSDSETSRGLIRLDSPAPEMEFVETDQTAPAGKFEVRVQNDRFSVNGRNSADTAFEEIFTVTRTAEGGRIGFGVADDDPDYFTELRFSTFDTQNPFLNLVNTANSANACPGVGWYDIPGTVQTSMLCSKTGNGHTAAELQFWVADPTKKLAKRMTLDKNGKLSIGDDTAIASSRVPNGSLVIGNGALCVDDGGTNCDDNTRNTGTIYAARTSVQGMDVAENYLVANNVGVADVVCIGASALAEHCGGEYDVNVMGVVSADPGYLLGMDMKASKAGKTAPIALSGRIPVKVTCDYPVKVGDPLVPSAVPGHAMSYYAGKHDLFNNVFWTVVDSLYDRQASIFGKALESCDSGTRTIAVWVN
jgi:hypothetical protein